MSIRALPGTLVLASLLLALSSDPAAAQDRAALLTEVSGTVDIARASGGGAVAASWGMQLFEGDRLSTGADGSATLLYSDNRLESVGSNGSITVAAAGGQAGTARSVSSDRIADVADLTLHRAGEGEIAALGGLRAGGRQAAVVAVTPRNSKILDGSPQFHWFAEDEFEEYRLSVRDESGEIWSMEGARPGAAYPADAPALEPGRQYFWQVTGIAMLDEIDSELAPFELIGASEREAVQEDVSEITSVLTGDGDANSRDYLLGALYAREELLGNAVEAFSRIAERHPDATLAHEILGKLYLRMGLKDQSIMSLTKALASSY